ncbi:hypothetical protein C0W54_21155 [Photobacterium kishitanii]|uniref:hypothetical protein n=1 Tax=Photobacterium kishitanii TaxID=318456 RepID=UPI000D158CFE|nr:hypothetical protein [Photobacterium kishitanii]PSW58774.1 hypothetical protein C0W54_21155 [Photobacterium kishitanii]
MRNVKTKITNIETALKAKGEIIFTGEYVDITISMLLISIDDMRIKVNELENIKETFDFIVLRSKIDKILKDAKKNAETKYATPFSNIELINDIAKAKNLINEAYILYVKMELRDEIELSSINQQLKESSNQLTDLNEQLCDFRDKKSEIDNIKDELKEIKNEVDDYLKNIIKGNDFIEDSKDEISTYLKKGEESINNIDNYKDLIKSHKNSLDDLNNKITPLFDKAEYLADELRNRLNIQNSTIKGNNAKHEELIENVSSIKTTAEDVLKRANTAHGSASRAGLAFAYKEKREQFGKVKFIYMAVLIGALAAIVLGNATTEFTFDKPEMLINKLLVTLPLTIIAFLSGQYAYRASRSEEEYGHKEALSLSYEGLKQAVVDSENKILSEKLLSQLVEAQGKNIAVSMDKVYLTPIDKMIQDLPKAMNKLGVSEVTITEIISLLIQRRDDEKVSKINLKEVSNDEDVFVDDIEKKKL